MYSKKIKHTDVVSCVESMCLNPTDYIIKGWFTRRTESIYVRVFVSFYHNALARRKISSFISFRDMFLSVGTSTFSVVVRAYRMRDDIRPGSFASILRLQEFLANLFNMKTEISCPRLSVSQ
mmetsp:Transcript_15854/g.18296  ORF Transcript_15854/g.18296 Transcript_15854/m.18296 type:complete len:122 (+) Transcript_15854:236-601(+)